MKPAIRNSQLATQRPQPATRNPSDAVPGARCDVYPDRSFEPWQVWPGSYDNPPARQVYPFAAGSTWKINHRTPIASIGSCFAREIRDVLLAKGFSYITEEAGHPASKHASAAWERTYNTFCLRQILEYTFEDWSPALRWWQSPVSGKVQDPYRRIILYDSVAEAEADFENHRRCSRRVFEQAELLIVTLGMTEVWEDWEDGSVICLPAGPYVNEGGDMSRYRFRVSSFMENLVNLERIRSLMAVHNPRCRLMITLSPVHLWATFRRDVDVISASCSSKATLRAAADEFTARHQNVTYFPAFEMATIFRPILGEPFFAQGRENFHINQETMAFVMEQFFKQYCDED